MARPRCRSNKGCSSGTWPVTAAVRAAGISVRAGYKWVARFRVGSEGRFTTQVGRPPEGSAA
ncbi:leucine zipper domain-containing protein [Roseixanthobacter finlandensis]|uniref:leucine zipper domain-containing protein n=1 Tax=Roseixanthobacter finlandensis TaxID=3119922 RepID=UPI00372D567A